MKGRLIFKETQSFRNTWIWWVLVEVMLLLLAGIVFGISQGFITEEPGGNTPGASVLVVILAGSFVVIGAIIWLLQVMKLTVQIDQGTIMYRFLPFITQTKSFHKWDLEDVYVRKYRPTVMDAGYSSTATPKGKSYNLKGKYGLQLVLKNNKRLFLGTQKPDELKLAVQKLKKNWKMN